MIYRTTDIKLGAVLLCEIPNVRFQGVNGDIINSKKVIEIELPAEYDGALKKMVEDYARKIQVVNVFQYNRALCIIRDALRSSGVTNGNRGQTTGVRYGDF